MKTVVRIESLPVSDQFDKYSLKFYVVLIIHEIELY